MASSRCVRTDTVTGSLMDSRSTRSCGRGQPCREGPTISGGEPCLTRGGRERDQQLEALEVERLGNVGENVTRERLARYPAVVVAGQHENARLQTQAAHLREELETTHARHVDVEQHQIEPIALERRELVAVDRERDLVLVVVPEPAENVRSIRTVAGSSSTIRMRLVERVSPGASSMAISETSHEVSSLTLGIVQGVVGALDQVGDVFGVDGGTGDAE